MTTERDSTMTLVHRKLAHILEKESNRAGLRDGWATVLIAAHTSIQMLADALDAHLATRDAVVSGDPENDERGNCNVCGAPLLYGERHSQCSAAIMQAEKSARESFASRKMAVPDEHGGEVILEHSGCGHGAQMNQLTVKLYPGDKVLMFRGRLGKAMLASKDEVK